VNGCNSSPVAFLEGLYFEPCWRNRGVARLLCKTVAEWAASLGCSEFASDVELGNEVSQQVHIALGFSETERVVYYRKELPRK
jgi:aminoglycoside 6'-N-acetyltransferase I